MHKIDISRLPQNFPTHCHSSEFWEALGRTVATFGFLEEMLGKAIFAFTATRRYPTSEIEAAYANWLPTLKCALSDQLGRLISSYEKAMTDNTEVTIKNRHELIERLRSASKIRNVLCHGSWNRAPDHKGRSIPFFVGNNDEVFETPVDSAFLVQLQRHTAELACDVINSVTQIGYQFPGSNGPGKPIF